MCIALTSISGNDPDGRARPLVWILVLNLAFYVSRIAKLQCLGTETSGLHCIIEVRVMLVYKMIDCHKC